MRWTRVGTRGRPGEEVAGWIGWWRAALTRPARPPDDVRRWRRGTFAACHRTPTESATTRCGTASTNSPDEEHGRRSAPALLPRRRTVSVRQPPLSQIVI